MGVVVGSWLDSNVLWSEILGSMLSMGRVPLFRSCRR